MIIRLAIILTIIVAGFTSGLQAQIDTSIKLRGKSPKDLPRNHEGPDLDRLDTLGAVQKLYVSDSLSRLRKNLEEQFESQRTSLLKRLEAQGLEYIEQIDLLENATMQQINYDIEQAEHNTRRLKGLKSKYEQNSSKLDSVRNMEFKEWWEYQKSNQQFSLDSALLWSYVDTTQVAFYQDSLSSLITPDTTKYEEILQAQVEGAAVRLEDRLSKELSSLGEVPNAEAFSKEAFKSPTNADPRLAVSNTYRRFAGHYQKVDVRAIVDQYTPQLKSATITLDSLQTKEYKLGTFQEHEKRSIEHRFAYGGNLQLNFDKVTTIDFSPWLGWKLTKKSLLGGGVNYTTAWDTGDGLEYAKQHTTVGYRGFAEYDFYKGFYAHAEFEQLYQPRVDNEVTIASQAHNGWLIGLGKTYRIKSKLSGNFQILYQINHTSESVRPSPWVVRFGVRIN